MRQRSFSAISRPSPPNSLRPSQRCQPTHATHELKLMDGSVSRNPLRRGNVQKNALASRQAIWTHVGVGDMWCGCDGTWCWERVSAKDSPRCRMGIGAGHRDGSRRASTAMRGSTDVKKCTRTLSSYACGRADEWLWMIGLAHGAEGVVQRGKAPLVRKAWVDAQNARLMSHKAANICSDRQPPDHPCR